MYNIESADFGERSNPLIEHHDLKFLNYLLDKNINGSIVPNLKRNKQMDELYFLNND